MITNMENSNSQNAQVGSPSCEIENLSQCVCVGNVIPKIFHNSVSQKGFLSLKHSLNRKKANAKWRQKNKKKTKEYNAKYHQENKERIKTLNVEWHQKNKNKRKTSCLDCDAI